MIRVITNLAREYVFGNKIIQKNEENTQFWSKRVENKEEYSFIDLCADNYYKAAMLISNSIAAAAIMDAALDIKYLKALFISEGLRLGTRLVYKIESGVSGRQREESVRLEARIKELESQLSERRGY